MHNSVLNDLKNLASKDLTNATAMPKELYSSNEILNLEVDMLARYAHFSNLRS